MGGAGKIFSITLSDKQNYISTLHNYIFLIRNRVDGSGSGSGSGNDRDNDSGSSQYKEKR